MSIATERQCPRCRGWLWAGSDGYGSYRSCINCGHYFDNSDAGRSQRSFGIARRTAALWHAPPLLGNVTVLTALSALDAKEVIGTST